MKRTAELRSAASLTALAWLLWLVWRAHAPYFSQLVAMHNYDEGYITAVAVRLRDGHMLPYVDAIDHRTPLLYWLVAALGSLAEPLSFGPVRIGALLAGLGSVLFTWWSGWLARRRTAGVIGALVLFVATVLVLGPYDGMAYNAEIVLDLFAMAALACLTAALVAPRLDRSALVLVFCSGLFIMASALAKQVGLVAIIPCGAWIACASRRPELTAGARRRVMLLFASGLSLPLLAVIILYAVNGQVHALYYWTIVRVRDIYMAPYTPALRHAAHVRWLQQRWPYLLALATMTTVVAARALPTARRHGWTTAYDAHGFELTVALGAVVTVLAAHAPLREWAHYYVQSFPWIGLLLGVFLTDEPRWRKWPHWRTLVIATLALALAATTIAERRAVGNYDLHTPRQSAMCRFMDEWSAPDEPVFIWGFAPEYYVYCQRRPASRFVATAVVAGFVEWFDSSLADEARWVAPGAPEALIADLETRRPPVLIDDGASFGPTGRKLYLYPSLQQYVDRRYCLIESKAKVDYYVRRRDDGTCRQTPEDHR